MQPNGNKSTSLKLFNPIVFVIANNNEHESIYLEGWGDSWSTGKLAEGQLADKIGRRQSIDRQNWPTKIF